MAPFVSPTYQWAKLIFGIVLVFIVVIVVILIIVKSTGGTATATTSGMKRRPTVSGYPARLYPSNQTGRWTGLQTYVKSGYLGPPHHPYGYLDVPNDWTGVPKQWFSNG